MRVPLRSVRLLRHDRRGAIGIMAAICLPIVIGFTALSVEYGYGLLIRDRNQRTADLASYAGALAHSETKSETRVRKAALQVSALNGVDADDVSVSITTSPKDAGAQAIHVTVTTTNTLFLAPVLGVDPKLDIAAQAYASIGSTENGCIIALDKSGSGVTLSGGVQVGASQCYVASNSDLVAPCGTKITAKSATYYSGSSESCPWSSNIVQADGSDAPVTQAYTSDPLDGHSGVAELVERFAVIRKAAWPHMVSVKKGHDIEFGGDTSPKATAAAIESVGCSYDPASFNEYWTVKWDIICAGSEISIGSLLVHGNVQVKFNTAGSKNTVYTFSGKIQNDFGTKLEFGDGVFSVEKGIIGTDLTFGAGTFHIGMVGEDDASSCGGARYSLCSGGKLTIGGPSTFVLDAGFFTGDGATLKLGAGNSNSYIIGRSSGDNAIGVGGGSTTYMADANSGPGVFRVNGDLNGGGGGSCLTIPAAAQHDIAGNVNLAGGARLGDGIYTVDGYFSVNTGGASCSDTVAVSGQNVTIVISGEETPSDWECREKAFCLTGGNAITIAAPQSGSYANLAVIGPQSSKNTSGAEITSGGRGKISGAFYFPHGLIDFGGGGRIEDAGNCLQLIGASISLSGGSQAMSECALSTAQGKVKLIQ
ncbi:Von Willebrand factor type A domain protein, associated with Flp pilus assembly (plasmid) [Sinorhizobium sojae CCBAU 05684]|uniref:von Willebrand factor type A domain protein, associated with Flp pilus assembly n=1 Tax=Sinorhizobium sojae CCBAU 05684 TaxID=716928 RepID=A0A249PLR2_9HYPH|nr:TadE/TadG family type IV pilus assembly protein [Sinorhizobium sojae]ASY66655.1 Von Willebrand factor type A domain protein, associated with Flp pilus assembly [Sinorhizobium sojae CCBAU 05684]